MVSRGRPFLVNCTSDAIIHSHLHPFLMVISTIEILGFSHIVTMDDRVGICVEQPVYPYSRI